MCSNTSVGKLLNDADLGANDNAKGRLEANLLIVCGVRGASVREGSMLATSSLGAVEGKCISSIDRISHVAPGVAVRFRMCTFCRSWAQTGLRQHTDRCPEDNCFRLSNKGQLQKMLNSEHVISRKLEGGTCIVVMVNCQFRQGTSGEGRDSGTRAVPLVDYE